ncbi:MAG: hypothetical protein HY280_10290, partial [Nitrospinae bacterium]|nr:hypothetical protein [Nitrospinota bacterium]
MGENIFALDVGGAFIKSAFLPEGGRPASKITPFEMWKNPEKLATVLKGLKPKHGATMCAITMTGELCDCFKNRREGVWHIVESAQKVFDDVLVFGINGGLLAPKEAIKNYRDVASANWAVVPQYIGRFENDFLLCDIGSTTTDLTPVRGGKIS